MHLKLKQFFNDRKGEDRTESLQVLVDTINNIDSNIINFTMMWGAGSKSCATKSDKDALLYLLHFLNRVHLVFDKKVSLTLILTDTHAYLNGYSNNITNQYFDDIIYHIEKHDFKYIFSSDMCKKSIQKKGYLSYIEYIDFIIPNSVKLFLELGIDEAQIKNFYKYALKHCRRISDQYQGRYFTNQEQAAKAYLYFADKEKRIISEKYKDSIFITYMSRGEEFALPNLPIVRLFSIKSGLRTRPWFS